MLNFTAILGKRALVAPAQESATPTNEILKPESFKKDSPSSEWTILKIGTSKDVPPELKEGQTVILNHRMGGQEMKGLKARIVSTDDILAIKHWPDEPEA